jgi:EmrB/QacA subfamily drug resistance transporter
MAPAPDGRIASPCASRPAPDRRQPEVVDPRDDDGLAVDGAIDETVVSVALPTIQRDLDMSQTELQWVVNAYLLALAAFVAVGGRLGEIFGQGRVFKIGAVVFLVASAACGFAESDAFIITARAVQGIGAALMIPPSGALVINAFSVKERGRAMGIYAGISMIFLALGPLVGGLLTQGWTWRAVFWINIPVGLVMLAMAAVSLPRDERDREARVDWPGAFTLVPGLVAIVLALMQAQTWGWTSAATIALLAGGAVLVVAFVLVERRSRWPLIALGLFRSRNFSVDNTVLALVQFALTGITVFGAIYVQDLLGFNAIEAGLSLLPLTLPLLLLAPRAGKVYDRIGPRALVAVGAGLLGISLIWAGLVLDQLDYWWLVPAYIVSGLGLALVMTPASTDAMNAAPSALRGEASGVMQTMRQVGGTVGLAIMGTVAATIQSNQLDDFADQARASPAQREQFERALSEVQGDPSALAGLPPETVSEAEDALVSGIQAAYYVGGAAVLAGAILAGLLLRRVSAADAPDAAVPATPGAHPALRVAVEDAEP